MGFPESYLADDEDLVLNLRPHWWLFAQPVAILVAVLALAVALTVFDIWIGLTWLGWLLVLAALVNLALVYGKWASTYFILSSERLITREGILSKRGVEIPLERINNINFSQSIFERLIQAGDLLIESAGESGQNRISNVRKPDAVQNAILQSMDDLRTRIYGGGGSAPAPAPAPQPDDIPTQIEKLARLRDQGALTDAEFERQKAKLLDRM